MSKKLGAFSAGGERPNVFLGEELSKRRDHSEHTAQTIDSEIMATLSEAYSRARSTLEERRDRLDALADALLDKEQLSAEEVGEILNGHKEDKDEGSGKKSTSEKDKQSSG